MRSTHPPTTLFTQWRPVILSLQVVAVGVPVPSLTAREVGATALDLAAGVVVGQQAEQTADLVAVAVAAPAQEVEVEARVLGLVVARQLAAAILTLAAAILTLVAVILTLVAVIPTLVAVIRMQVEGARREKENSDSLTTRVKPQVGQRKSDRTRR
jgi:hypothetical protein